MVSVRSAFTQIQSLVARDLPDAAPFRPPADPEALDRLATVLNQALPEELVELLQTSDGQDDPDQLGGVLNYMHVMTANEIASMYAMLTDVLDEMIEPEPQPSAYRWQTWSQAWIPFLAFENSTCCIDLDPGDNGTIGQVFIRPNVPDLDAPKAVSLEAFFDRVVQSIEDGTATIADGSYDLDWLW